MRFVVVQADIHELALGGDQKIEGGCTNWLLKSANHLIEILPLSLQDHSKKVPNSIHNFVYHSYAIMTPAFCRCF